MNPVVKAQLSSFREHHDSESYSENELFEVFTIYSVLNGALTANVDPFRAHLPGSEFGVDGIAVLIQGELCTNTDEVADAMAHGSDHTVEFIFFQAKSGEKLDYGEVSKFFDAVYGFFTSNVVQETPEILDFIAVKDAVLSTALKRNPNVRCYFATTGSSVPGDQLRALIELTQSRLQELNIFDDTSIKMVGAKELQNGYRSATNAISESVEILKPITLPDHPSVQEAFLGLVTAKDLVRLATHQPVDGEDRRINSSVFFDNVRDFNPESEINKSILNEIEAGDVESFVFKNNGVTVVSRNIRRRGDKFELEDYQIVNGCQTSNILFTAGEAAESVAVPFRLIGSSDPEFVSSIIVGTNKQNEVKEDQFWALTAFMKDLEEYSRGQDPDAKIFVERRENQYRGSSVERTRIFKPSEIVKSVVSSYLFLPNRAARGYRGIRAEYSSELFLEQHRVEPYHAIMFANYRFDFSVRNKRVSNLWRIYKYYFLYVLGYESTQGKEVFKLSVNEQKKAASQIIEKSLDEEKLVEIITGIGGALDKIVSGQNLDSRERIRDFIRTPTCFDFFKSDYFGN